MPDHIGVETVDPSVNDPRMSDSSFVTLDRGVEALRGTIPRDFHSPPYVPNYTIDSTAAFSICGETLYKVGRTTGETGGEVSETCADFVDVDWTEIPNSPESVTFLCQDVVDAESQGGDSGSPVFAKVGNYGTISLRGVLWGGDGSEFVFSPLRSIEQEIGPSRTSRGGTSTPRSRSRVLEAERTLAPGLS